MSKKNDYYFIQKLKKLSRKYNHELLMTSYYPGENLIKITFRDKEQEARSEE